MILSFLSFFRFFGAFLGSEGVCWGCFRAHGLQYLRGGGLQGLEDEGT